MSENRRQEHYSNGIIYNIARKGIANPGDLEAMEHINQCEECFETYLSCMEENLLSLPVSFKEGVLEAAKETMKRKGVEEGIKKAFYRYCFRVGFACACSLVLLFSLDSPVLSNIGARLAQTGKTGITRWSEGWETIQDLFDNQEVENEREEK